MKATPNSARPARSPSGFRDYCLLAIMLLVIALLLVRMTLPYGVQWYVNRKLDEAPKYEGSIGDVDLHLYRGAYSVEDIDIRKTEGDVPVPLFSGERVEFSILWSALLKGSVVADITFYSPEINIVDNDNERNTQTGEEGHWLSILNGLVPFRIDKVTIHEGALHFRKYDEEMPVSVSVSALEASLLNLANSEDLVETRFATLEAQGTVADSGQLVVSAGFNPFSRHPTFELDARVTDVAAQHMSDLVSAYAPLDLESGEFSIVMELEASAGQLEGYIKPLAHDLEIVSWQGDVIEDRDNPIQIAWESVIGILSEIFENQGEDQLATLIPLEGEFGSPDTSNLVIIGNILKNAFIEAFNLDFESTPATDSEANRQATRSQDSG